MNQQRSTVPRREFLAVSGAWAIASAAGRGLAFDDARRPRVAAIFTELRHRSHACNILMNLMGTCLFRDKRVDPGVDVVAWYADQFPPDDMAREASHRLSVPLFDTIDQALCLGAKNLSVDAVLLIAAEQTGRRAFLVELDPLYFDVVVQRFEQFTGRPGDRRSCQKSVA